MVANYISNLECATDLCTNFEERVLNTFFQEGQKEESSMPNFVWSLGYEIYFRPVKACIQLCKVLKLQSLEEPGSIFFVAASDLNDPRSTKTLKQFQVNLGVIKGGFTDVRDEVSSICSSFDEEEKQRMNEAIHDYFEECYYSCVAMSVSAVESRLLKLMYLANAESRLKLEKKTLGQLILEYAENKDSYKHVVPERHEPLLQLSNTYRTFSVHPKKQKITGRLASSILNLAIEFLIDQDTKPEVAEAQLISSQQNK